MIQDRIAELRKKRHAVILAHNYTDGAVQDIADFTGDSLELSIKARDAGAEVLVFAGVRFMAETAKLLSPKSTVLLPAAGAGCRMADMAPAAEVRRYRESHPGTVLVAYVNTTAAAKAEVDVCCTSANAEKVVRSIDPGQPIMFLPDQNLGANVMARTGRKMELWPGYCPVHHQVPPETIDAARAAHPGAPVLVHPECQPAVVARADHALSTGQMLRFVRESAEKAFIIGTERGILHRMRRDNPGKEFFPLEPTPLLCPNMKLPTLENIAEALENLSGAVELPEELMERARRPIDKMLAL